MYYSWAAPHLVQELNVGTVPVIFLVKYYDDMLMSVMLLISVLVLVAQECLLH